VEGKPVCENKTCVQCTPATEGQYCRNEANQPSVCHPKTFTCTQTALGKSKTCESCVSDSACVTDHRCVPMFFKGAARADGYCLKLKSTGCSKPYLVNFTRGSLSKPEPRLAYCAINEVKTTCEAVLQAQVPDPKGICGPTGGPPDATKCGVPNLNDGMCEKVNGSTDYRCTYECEDATTECFGTTACDCTGAGCIKFCGGP